MADIIASKVICRQPGRYIGWPTIDKVPADHMSGDLSSPDTLLVVFSGDRDGHIGPFGKTFMGRTRAS